MMNCDRRSRGLDLVRGACVPELFAAQAARTPDAIAVISSDTQVTYAKLAERAGWLADRLRGLGVGADVVVALCVERGVDMVIGLLGILQAGGAYLPLEPTTPAERLAIILRDGRPRVLLTQRALADRLPVSQLRTVFLDDLYTGHPHRMREAWPRRRTEPLSLAYVIYTSGSTGAPKGIAIDHQALRDRALANIGILGFRAGDRILQFVGLSFDAAGADIYSTLLSGATLVVHPDPARASPAELVEYCLRHGVIGAGLPPVAWHLLTDMLASTGTSVPWLRILLTGGESIPVERLARWASVNPHRPRFLYAYGPTETTITATLYESSMDPDQIRELNRVPIGTPMPGTRIHLLDDGRQVRPGEIGELYIGGAGVARGYASDPALTAACFLPSSDEPGGRMYRTGDLARLTAAGDLEFVGRADEQVKIRGFRIDLRDVEAALAQHPQLSCAAVNARDGGLAAYCVPAQGADPSSAGIRKFLRERLPGYMIPAAVSMLDSLPLTPGGKVDRQALPEPLEDEPGQVPDDDRPVSPIELALGEIWCELLRRESIGVSEDFFDAGGDSLLANRMIGKIQVRLGIRLPLREVFSARTIAGLVPVITKLAVSAAETGDLLELLTELESVPSAVDAQPAPESA
jgi:amino acid adenylation domain-containing protein